MKNNKLKNFPSVYYVSLEECKDRQQNIEKQFAKYDIQPTAIISKRFAESDDEITGKFLDQMNGGTMGCVVSHLKAIRKWYEETDENYAFFCEDDLSLETVEYWDFTWEEFIETIPENVMCVQLLVIREYEYYETFGLRKRLWGDWAGTAYIITRDYAKILVDHYCLGEKRFHLELPGSGNVLIPLLENVLFETIEKSCYSIPLFVEDVINFKSTFVEDRDLNDGNQKNWHSKAHDIVLDYWKNKIKTFTVRKKSTSSIPKNEIELLLEMYSADPENADNNFNLGVWYWNENHTAPALSYFLRSAERAEDSVLAYESLLWAHQCYEKQGTRDSTARTLLQHAVNLLPTRPEAYFLLAKFHAKREQWTDTYTISHQGLTFSQKDLEPLRNSVGYMGEFALLYEKAVSGWWWGKSNEAREILQYIQNNYELPEQYEKSVQDLLITYGVGDNLKKIGENIQNKLSDIFDIQRYQTDKNDLGYIDNFYDDFFMKLKNNPITMLEIGVYNGGSIQLWKDYLHFESKIYAGDVNYFNHIEGTCSVIGDMYSEEQISKFDDNYFDLIIDDGPHTFESFVVLMQKYHSKIKYQGTLIIEDIIQTNWVKPLSELSYALGYSNCEIIEMTGKQKTDELLNRWKEGLYILNITK
jgi:GR25 family glycosyltransferase involved in LPS biosynthesis